ncbi:phosphatidate cytidylyltransferase [Inhella gelatinilytica]|uniref:Phosphatidate cytidylyltransferase n=1 Tax=Inhella gelatinilytica TaxID=2795030 RepID=A0A931IUV2_9BURK|nr:phosphatidate cytidylyltransferase [Inhella gelatinilytica]MBH9552372.1 phosphatidate cytidylyltransferase [Inhella gelatinilytica]
MGDLKYWSPADQIALLFAMLFGLLMLVTAGGVLYRARHPREELSVNPRSARAQFRRDLNASWVGALLFWLAWISGPVGATILFGGFSFFCLREFITLQHTTRSDHRTLIAAFFIILPLQYIVVAHRRFDLFTVLIPVYAFFAIPVISAFSGDKLRFLERNAKIQWGIMVCVYGLSHAPALLLLEFPRYPGRGAFLLFFLVTVVSVAQIVQEAVSRSIRSRPTVRAISRSFSKRAWWSGALAGAFVGALLYWVTPFKAGQAFVMAFIAAGSGTLGALVMKAMKREAGIHYWGNRSGITGAVGLLDRTAALCFAAPIFFHSVRWYFKLSV